MQGVADALDDGEPLCGDDVLRHRVHRGIVARGHALPGWLLDLHDSTVGGVVEMVHVLGDGDNVMIEVSLPGDSALSVVVYIDHNLGTLVKDAFVVPEPLDALIERMRTIGGPDPDTTCDDLDPAQARARITAAARRRYRSYSQRASSRMSTSTCSSRPPTSPDGRAGPTWSWSTRPPWTGLRPRAAAARRRGASGRRDRVPRVSAHGLRDQAR